MRVRESAHLHADLAVRALALALDLLDLLVDLLERARHGLEQALDRLLPVHQRAVRIAHLHFQRGLRELEEARVVAPQRIGRERFEGIAQAFLGALDQRELLLGRAPFAVHLLLAHRGEPLGIGRAQLECPALRARLAELPPQPAQLQERADQGRCECARGRDQPTLDRIHGTRGSHARLAPGRLGS